MSRCIFNLFQRRRSRQVDQILYINFHI